MPSPAARAPAPARSSSLRTELQASEGCLKKQLPRTIPQYLGLAWALGLWAMCVHFSIAFNIGLENQLISAALYSAPFVALLVGLGFFSFRPLLGAQGRISYLVLAIASLLMLGVLTGRGDGPGYSFFFVLIVLWVGGIATLVVAGSARSGSGSG